MRRCEACATWTVQTRSGIPVCRGTASSRIEWSRSLDEPMCWALPHTQPSLPASSRRPAECTVYSAPQIHILIDWLIDWLIHAFIHRSFISIRPLGSSVVVAILQALWLVVTGSSAVASAAACNDCIKGSHCMVNCTAHARRPDLTPPVWKISTHPGIYRGIKTKKIIIVLTNL